MLLGAYWTECRKSSVDLDQRSPTRQKVIAREGGSSIPETPVIEPLRHPAQPIVEARRHDPRAVVRHQRTLREWRAEIRHVGARHDPAGIAFFSKPAADEVRKRR